MNIEKYDKIVTVGDLANILKKFPQNAKLWVAVDDVADSIDSVEYHENDFLVVLVVNTDV